MGTTADRTDAANAARRERTALMLTRIEQAISKLQRENTPITVRILSDRAGVSATFIYENHDARNLLVAARAITSETKDRRYITEAERCESSWRERALNAEDALTLAHSEIHTQRRRIGDLSGKLLDLAQPMNGETAHRLSTENTALQTRVRQLSLEHTTLRERLDAARSTNRFLDRRVADLEAQLAEHLTTSS